MTCDEFEQRYTKSNSDTLAMLRKHGRYAIPCDCGDGTCQGWQMVNIHTAEPREVGLIVTAYPEVAAKIDPASVELYKIAAEINEQYS